MIIFRYICKELLMTLLGIVLVLLVILTTHQFVRFLNYAAEGRLTMLAVMQIMILQAPLLLGYLLPLGFYLSILIVFGRLYMDHEMDVLSACGVSQQRLLSIVFCFAMVLSVAVAWLTLYLQPIVYRAYKTISAEAAVTVSADRIIPKRFQKNGHGTVFYADDVDHISGKMKDVFLAQPKVLKQKGSPVRWDVTAANIAREKKTKYGSSQFMIFYDGYRYIGIPGQNDFKTIKFGEYGIKLTQAHKKADFFPDGVSTKVLWPQRLQNKVAAAAIQWRIAMPIAVLIFSLLSFSMAKVKLRSGKFSRMVPAILICLCYINFLFLGKAWIIRGQIPIGLGMWWIHGLALAVALFLLFFRLEGYCYFRQRKRVA